MDNVLWIQNLFFQFSQHDSLVRIKQHQLFLLVNLDKECWYTKYYIVYKIKHATTFHGNLSRMLTGADNA